MYDEWQKIEDHTQLPRHRPIFTTVNPSCLVVVISLTLFVAAVVFLEFAKPGEFNEPEPVLTPTLSTVPQRPNEGRIIVNITRFEHDPYLHVSTVSGKIKNFTNKTLKTLKLRFTFYDRSKRMVHTETRVIFLFEQFRPNDVYAFKEDFFNLPRETHYVDAEVAETW